ncbi:hypothetical protein [uncultured Methanoregula sp.]|uniref:hypothetical protein n=1 Tax=uncultured Methanoregula sp. TaxID=1005933 RepID=UPI002AAB8515|nr:hypothetical protein [uncultured Methanoregula sp.]
MHKRMISVMCLLLVIASLFLVTAVCAIVENIEIPKSIDPLDRDRPENIAALKTHIAYVGESQEARMNGVIAYINNISGSEGIDKLQQIRDDYLSAAASIPLMQTSDNINALRDDMCVQTKLFAEETKVQILFFNGTPEGMRETADASMNVFDISFNSVTDPLWLSRENARVKVFARESEERNFTLRSLSEKGIDITRARQISDQIDTKRSDLEAALRNKQDEAMFQANTGIKNLKQQFRNTIGDYRANLEIQMSSAAIMARNE